MKKKKIIAGIFILVGIAFILGALYYLLTPNASEESGSLLKTVGAIIVFLSGAGSSIKGWKDLFKKDTPSPPTIKIEQSGNNTQISTGEHGKNIQTKTYVEHAENFHEATPKPFSPLFSIPKPPLDFIGRDEELEAIIEELSHGGTAAISGLSGMGGVGKTVLGLQAAHQLRDQFPDAQLYIELKGTTEPISPEEAMRQIIHAFEPTADLRTANETQLAGLYLSILQGKKTLLFFDNARDAMQVKSLVEGISCAALVTSRRHFSLAGLHPTRLDVMTPVDAETLLFKLCPRIEKDADQIAKLCGYLPLALRIAGNFLAMNESWTTEEYIAELSDQRKRLGALKSADDPDLDVEATIQLSYEQLDEVTQAHWRKLAVFPAPFNDLAAETILELDEIASRNVLEKLCQFSFILYKLEQKNFQLHDLVRDFALSQLTVEEKFTTSLLHATYIERLLTMQTGFLYKGAKKFHKDWLYLTHIGYTFKLGKFGQPNNESRVKLLQSLRHPTLTLQIAYICDYTLARELIG